MEKGARSSGRFCGSCHYHSVYRYPDFVFCEFRYMNRENPVVSTLEFCEQWKPHQGCFCVEDALRKVEKVNRKSQFRFACSRKK